MRVSCVLVAAAAIAVLTNSCGAAPTSARAPEVSTDTVSDVRVSPGTEQHDRKTLLRSELEDENEDSEDDEDNEDNRKKEAADVDGKLLKFFNRLSGRGYNPVKLGNTIPAEEYTKLRKLYRNWYYHFRTT
ncbi:uncharacterized protein PITG_18224 [Phytophthora infestans T30-4]|uniref:RxLR effector protein n=1 Tax=Phytophthora infestans (strain T30-4) TaxID=403677 RepID=D0NXM7_PHYIT|nr:uncharacterized protein PITG_18224 [Phytophthora infestans T30-4]EEY67827.1 conserved hypothetical protein [Phytophthora infestans T30-4]|eukprot:XP_002997852.1 conserved hypothetical protein [Phytophthora infestans T30-4]